jgi:two-component system, NarL family, sensor kinase
VTPGMERRRLSVMTSAAASDRVAGSALAARRSALGRRALATTGGALIAALTIIAALTAVRLGWSWADALDAFVVSNASMGVAFGGCGALLAWHRPGNPIGWLFLGGGFLQAVAAACSPVHALALESGAPLPVVRLLSTLFLYSWPWAIGLCIPVALLLFPDGRPVTPRWRPVVIFFVVTAPLFVLEMGSAPVPIQPGEPVGYLTLAFYDRLGPLWAFTEVRSTLAYVVALIALIVRYRRGAEAVRRQLLWLLLALAVVIIALVPWGLVAGTPVAVLLSIPLIPVAVTVAIVRHQLLDIRLVVSRAVAWLVLSLAVIVVYVGLVAVLERVIASSLGQSAVATVILVLLAAPALPRLQRLVDRAIYGDRANPTRVVSRLGQQLTAPEAGLSGVVASVREALRLPYVGLRNRSGTLAADGSPPAQSVEIPLTYGGEATGCLTVGLRTGERRLSAADRRVLELLAAPLAAAVHATVVSEELQASRERLVGTREEERRRLRRDLHDGLGPTLTGIAFTADAAANSAAASTTDPARTVEFVNILRRDTRQALADVRRVVDGLRPPALDELGLVAALRERAEQLGWRADGAPVQARLEVPAPLPPLPAAAEVAAYRVVTEALTNIARHSQADHALVCLGYDGGLEVVITDDGAGSGSWVAGVGLEAMRERTTELGGKFAAGPIPGGGRVRAWFPVIQP